MKKTLFFLLIVMMGLCTFAQISGEEWGRIGLLSGEDSLCVAVSPGYDVSDYFVTIGTPDGLWYSWDGGINWQHPPALWGAQINDIVISPNFYNDGTIYAVDEGGYIYRTTNWGVTWFIDFMQPSNYPFRALAISPNYASDGIVFAGSYGNGQGTGGLYERDPSGFWIYIEGPGDANFINDLAISPSFPSDNTLYLATNKSATSGFPGLWRYNPSWQNMYQGLPSDDFLSITISPAFTSDGKLFAGSALNGPYITSNGGTFWNLLTCNPSPTIPAIQLSPTYRINASDDNLLIGTIDGLRHTKDDGNSCNYVGPPPYINDIAFSPKYMDTCTYFVATPSGLYSPTGCGLSHPNTENGPKGGEINHVAIANGLSAVFATDPNNGTGGVFKSKTVLNFVQYNTFENDTNAYHTSKVPKVTALAISPVYTEWQPCGGDYRIILVGTVENGDGYIYESVDGGNRLRDIGFPCFGGTCGHPKVSAIIFSPSFVSDRTIFVGTDQGVWKGYNSSGFSWSWQLTGSLDYYNVIALGISPNFDNNTGASGTPSATVFCAGTDSSGTFGAFHYSTNFGGNWAPTLNGVIPSFDVSSSYPTNGGVYVGTTNNYFWYNNSVPPGGAGWNLVDLGLPEPNITAVKSTPSRVVVGTSSSGIYLWNYGGSFYGAPYQPTDFRITCLDKDKSNPDFMMAGTKGERLFYTVGDGYFYPTSGYNTLPDDVTGMAVFPYNNSILFAASPTYGFFISEDTGNRWRPWNFAINTSVCTIEGAYSVAVTERDGFPTWLNVFGGTVNQGIVMRYIWNNPPYIDWIDYYDWYPTSQTTGDFERLAFMGQCDPAWACSNTLGPFRNFNPTDPCNSGYYQWDSQGNGLPEYTCEDLRFGQAAGFKGSGPFSPTGSISWSTTSNSGVYRTTDGGSLTNLVPTWIEANGAGIGRLSDLQTRSVIQLTNITGVPTTVLCGTLSNGVYRSSDLGSTSWDQSNDTIGYPYSLYAKEFLEAPNGDVLVAMQANGYNGGVFLSGDRGRHWDNISAGLPPTIYLTDMVNDSSVPISYYATSTDGGAWTRTITANPYPTVTSIVGSSGPSTGGTQVDVYGTGFTSGCVAVFGDEDATTLTYYGSTHIKVSTPAHTPGSVVVGVRNPDTRRGDCAACIFTFTDAGESDGITLTLSKSTGVQLDWVPSGNVTVRRATNPQMSSGVEDHLVNGGTYTDNTGALADSNTYYYKVW